MDLDVKNTLTELRKGDEAAFTKLYFAYSKRLFAFAIKYLRNEDEVEEIIQEVFLGLWNNRENLKEELSFEAYLFTITKNAILNTIRSKKHHIGLLNLKDAFPAKSVWLEDELNFNELQKAYYAVIDSLAPRKREVFILSRVKLLSYEEISRQLGISVKTVENHMTSALAEIRMKISSLGFVGVLFIAFFL